MTDRNEAAEQLRDYLVGVEDNEEMAALLDAALAYEFDAGSAPPPLDVDTVDWAGRIVPAPKSGEDR